MEIKNKFGEHFKTFAAQNAPLEDVPLAPTHASTSSPLKDVQPAPTNASATSQKGSNAQLIQQEQKTCGGCKTEKVAPHSRLCLDCMIMRSLDANKIATKKRTKSKQSPPLLAPVSTTINSLSHSKNQLPTIPQKVSNKLSQEWRQCHGACGMQKTKGDFPISQWKNLVGDRYCKKCTYETFVKNAKGRTEKTKEEFSSTQR